MAIVINTIIGGGGGGASLLISAQPSATATIKKDGVTLGTAVLDSTGNGEFDVEEEGTYDVTVGDVAQSHRVIMKTITTFKSLSESSWEDISRVSQSGGAENVFSIGDRKKIHLQGTIGTLAVNQDFWVYIIGFDHYGSIGIDFGTFKDAETGGNDICLVDSKYRTSSKDGTKCFNMIHGASPNKVGWKGWQGCDMRYDILGSCKAKNQQNAPSDTATNPVTDTFMSCLPLELRKVMKPMKIWTDNVGGQPSNAGDVTTTIDYLPFLAESEIFGKRKYTNVGEQHHQNQYEYYKLGNSKIKNRHDTIKGAFWWERSPITYGFGLVNNAGNEADTGTDYSFGVAPIFRV